MTCADENWGNVLFALPVMRRRWDGLPYRVYWMRYWLDHGLLVRHPASGEYTPRWMCNRTDFQ